MEQTALEVSFGSVGAELIDRVAQLESQGFPADEAASRDTMLFRIQNASTYFVGTFVDAQQHNKDHQHDKDQEESKKTLIGYVVGTCSNSERLEHENMFKHNKDGTHLCVHSVLTEPTYQGKGIAKKALFNYVKHIKQEAQHITKISLIAKESKTGLYESCGFKMIGVSPVEHGQDTWFELSMDLTRE